MKPIQHTQSTSLQEKDTPQSLAQNTVQDNDIYMSLIKHMDKIIQALYMITDLVDDAVSLKSVIRNNSVSIGQTLLELSLHSGSDATNQCEYVQRNLNHLLSSFTLLYQYHDVSDMNYQIVSAELKKINTAVSEIAHLISNKTSNHIQRIHNNFFEAVSHTPIIKPVDEQPHVRAVETSHVQDATRSEPVSVSPLDINILKDISTVKKATLKQTSPDSTKTSVSAKEKRHQNIMNILKQKKNASINDICSLFKDCSSKTIQRDLVELIDSKKVVKRGDRRWSTYNLS